MNSSSAAPVQKWLGTALASGDAPSGKTNRACYDGTNWQVDTIGNAPSGGAGTSTYWLPIGNIVTNNNTPSTNEESLYALALPTTTTFGHVEVEVGTLDATNSYSFGVFSSAGPAICTTTASNTPVASTGKKQIACSQGTVTANAGRIYIGVTTSGAVPTAKFTAVQTVLIYDINNSFIATTSAAQPASITPPSDNFNFSNYPTFVGLVP